MIQALKKNELDVIVALTEGLVADIVNHSDIRLLGTYVVRSPVKRQQPQPCILYLDAKRHLDNIF